MQNIASLISQPANGKGTNTLIGTGNSPVEGVSDVLSGQSPSFLHTLHGFIADNSTPAQSHIDQSNPLLAQLALQELPQDGDGLPIQDLSSSIELPATAELSTTADLAGAPEYSISQIKEFLKNLLADLSNFNNDTHISPEQKTTTEKLAAQLSEIQHLIQESDGTDITIPASLANGILSNIQALGDSGVLETQRQGPTNLTNNNTLVSTLTDQPERSAQPVNTQISADKSNATFTLDDTRINQLSDMVQNLVVDSRGHAGSKAESGQTGILKSSSALFDTRSSDTLIGNITGLGHQVGNPVGDKVVTSLPINSAFHQSSWGDEVGERIKWMVGQNIQSARLSLNPPQLGPIEVKITVQNDQMNVAFTAHHAAVRDALESALPRLREMFGDSGLNLADVDISQHSFSDQRRAAPDIDTSYSHDETGEHNNELSAGVTLNQRISLHNGLVDYYA